MKIIVYFFQFDHFPCSYGTVVIYSHALSVSDKTDSCSLVPVVVDQPNVITEEDGLSCFTIGHSHEM